MLDLNTIEREGLALNMIKSLQMNKQKQRTSEVGYYTLPASLLKLGQRL